MQGFTLLELLVVLVIAGMTLGVVSYRIMPDDRQALQEDTRRIALLLQLARDEAIVRNRPVAFEADQDHYRFLMRDNNRWQPITQDDTLRERSFKGKPVLFSMTPAIVNQPVPIRIIFGREPVDKPFVLTLSLGSVHASIRADGIGHFTVE